MHIAKSDIPVKIDAPGAVARQTAEFGDPGACGPLAGEYFSLGAGADVAPLLKGLRDDACQAAHWGYMVAGAVVVSYTDGSEESCAANDLFYWPPGHSVRVTEDAEVVLFSPRAAHAEVIDHMLAQMAAT